MSDEYDDEDEYKPPKPPSMIPPTMPPPSMPPPSIAPPTMTPPAPAPPPSTLTPTPPAPAPPPIYQTEPATPTYGPDSTLQYEYESAMSQVQQKETTIYQLQEQVQDLNTQFALSLIHI